MPTNQTIETQQMTFQQRNNELSSSKHLIYALLVNLKEGHYHVENRMVFNPNSRSYQLVDR